MKVNHIKGYRHSSLNPSPLHYRHKINWLYGLQVKSPTFPKTKGFGLSKNSRDLETRHRRRNILHLGCSDSNIDIWKKIDSIFRET